MNEESRPPRRNLLATTARALHVRSVSRATAGDPPFLSLRRVTFCVEADPRIVNYDVVERTRSDAAVICAYFRVDGSIHVSLRTVLRPPLVFGRGEAAGDTVPCVPLWEVAAGLIDHDETPADAAARELSEELGFSVTASSLLPLGPPVFGAAGVLAERLFFFAADVTGLHRSAPEGDGGPLEDFGDFADIPLTEALEGCADGSLQDLKTELLLRRLDEKLRSLEPRS